MVVKRILRDSAFLKAWFLTTCYRIPGKACENAVSWALPEALNPSLGETQESTF